MIARMKLIPVHELIDGKRILLIDDSIVRGTQLRETVDFLYESGASEVHMRSACPPLMYGCKYLAFSRNRSDMELLARQTVQKLEGDEGAEHLEEYIDPATKRGKCLVKEICESMGIEDRTAALLLNNCDKRIGLTRMIKEYYADDEELGKILLDNQLPSRVDVKNTETAFLPINLTEPNSDACKAFRAVVAEMNERGVL